ncbi:MAG TPA: hypothetical protein DC034_08035 [Clostridium sp.]|jgi:hypothetical protein|nr:hypothetical protein [Clostridium sp.]
MTINKYFKNGEAVEKFVAFSSWGKRFSISADLLKDASRKYPQIKDVYRSKGTFEPGYYSGFENSNLHEIINEK